MDHLVIVFDRGGKEVYRDEMKQNVQAVAMGNEEFFVMNSDGVVRIKTSGGEKTSLPCATDGRAMLALDDGRILLCSPQRAVYYRFSS